MKKEMTREEFRMKLYRQRFGTTSSDQFTTLCLRVQLHFNELDHRRILDMPYTTFNELLVELDEMSRANSSPQRAKGGFYG